MISPERDQAFVSGVTGKLVALAHELAPGAPYRITIEPWHGARRVALQLGDLAGAHCAASDSVTVRIDQVPTIAAANITVNIV